MTTSVSRFSVLLLGILSLLPLRLPAATQLPPAEAPLPAAQPLQGDAQPLLTREALNQLLAPIALYPDALIGLILPASTVPSDVVLGARYVKQNGPNANVTDQPWDDSVKSLVHYPDVLKWMDENLDWTTSVGQAFVNQPADVMDAIQQLRTQAKAAGNLTDTPQQKVVEEREHIRIVPAQPDVIYVPSYDPYAVYNQPYSSGLGPLLSFGAGFAVGSWLGYDFDWGNHRFYRGNWCGWNNGGWGGNGWNHWNHGGGGGGGSVNVININNTTASTWQPNVNSVNRFRNNQARVRTARINTLAATNPHGQANAWHGHHHNANFNEAQLRPTVPLNSAEHHGKNRNFQNTAQVNNASLTTASKVNGGSAHEHGTHHETTPAPTTAAPHVHGQHGQSTSEPATNTTTSTRHGHTNHHSTTTATSTQNAAAASSEHHAQHHASKSEHNNSHHSQQNSSQGAQAHQSHQNNVSSSHGGNHQTTQSANQSHGNNKKSDKKKKNDKSNNN